MDKEYFEARLARIEAELAEVRARKQRLDEYEQDRLARKHRRRRRNDAAPVCGEGRQEQPERDPQECLAYCGD